MKKIIVIFSLMMMVNNTGNAQEKIPQEALEEVFTDLNGVDISFGKILDQYKGKVVFIDIWASWCPDCIKGLPKLKELQQTFPDIIYLYLSYDRAFERWQEATVKYELEGDHYLIRSDWKKGSFKEYLKIDWIPRYMILDQKGNIALFKAIEADDEKIYSTLKNIL